MSTAVTKHNAYATNVAKAKKSFVQIYGKEAEERFAQEANFAVMAARKNPKLYECDPASVLDAVKSIAFTGMSLNPIYNHAALVPRGGKCVLDPQYQGLCQVAYDTGLIQSITADVVCTKDVFEWELGDNAFIRHKPNLNDRGEAYAVYGIIKLANGGKIIAVKDRAWIKKRSDVQGYKAVWDAWFHEMAKKTIIKNMLKALPKSPKLNYAMAAFDQANPVDLANPGQVQTAPMTTEQALQGIAGATTAADLKRVGEAMPDSVWKEVEEQYRAKEHEFKG